MPYRTLPGFFLCMLTSMWAMPSSSASDPLLGTDADARLLEEKSGYAKLVAELEAIQPLPLEELTKALLLLGQAEQLLSRQANAAKTYEKALYYSRINVGLNHSDQLPILNALMTIYDSVGNWQMVDDYMHLQLHIARLNFPVGSEQREQSLARFTQWKLTAAKEELVFGYSNSAEELSVMHKREIRSLLEQDDFAGKDIQLASLYLQQARLLHTLATIALEAPLRNYETGTAKYKTERQCQAVMSPVGRGEWVCSDVPAPNINYYIEPALRKNQSIAGYLSEMKKSILKAYDYLQNESLSPEQINPGLAEVQNLTQDYNRFVSTNGLK